MGTGKTYQMHKAYNLAVSVISATVVLKIWERFYSIHMLKHKNKFFDLYWKGLKKIYIYKNNFQLETNSLNFPETDLYECSVAFVFGPSHHLNFY